MKKFALLLVGTLLILGATFAQAQDDITLTYYTVQPEEIETAMVEICEAELGFDVDLNFVEGGVNGLMTELRALNTAGDLPDVFWMSSGFVDEFALDGLLLNLQEFVDRDIMPQAENYFTASFDAARFPDKAEGDMYAFPNHFVETILYYNIDAFDEAGIDYPTSEWTWDDFRAAAEALTIDEDEDGLVDQYGHYFFGRYAHIEALVYQNGGRWLSDDKTEFAASPEAVETVEFLMSLIEEGLAPTPAETEGLPNPFFSGLAAMWIDGSWAIDGAREEADFAFGIAAPPRGPQWTEDTAHGWSDMTSIAFDTEFPEESWALINCLTGPNRTADLVEGGKIPVYRPVAESAEWLEEDLMPANKRFLLEWAEFIGPNAFTPGWGEWRGYSDGAGLQGQLGLAFDGIISIEEAIAGASETANNVLARFYGDE